ncbi:Cyclic nucleotide-binding domain protein [Elizabethkingia miricola]|nr:Cyclic nucleotide-binding domain protein [Elizabethkingia miricola]
MLTPETLNKIKQAGTKISIKRNDFFIRENEICSYIGIIESGTMYSYFEDAECNLIVNELYRKHAIVTSYRSFLTCIPSPTSIKAYSDVVVYTIEKKLYDELLQNYEWGIIFKEVADQLFINKCFKETSLIKLKARERYLELISRLQNIEQDFPQHLIASYLKIRPETLSRIKSLDLHQHKF